MQDHVVPNKSTNVRSLPIGLQVLRAGLRAVEAGSPELAARLGEHVFRRTSRRAAPDWEEQIVSRGERFDVRHGGMRLAAWSYGEGPAVLLAHGWNGRGSQLGAFVDPLVEAGFRVVAYDAPGHGQSRGTSASLFAFADAFDAMLDAVRPAFGPAHGVIAHSMGGAGVTLSMSRQRQNPASVFERALRDTGLPVRRFAFVAPPIDVRDFVRGFSNAVGFSPATQKALGQRIEERFSVSLEDLYGPALVRSMRAPLLVVHDEEDREVPVRCGRLLAEAWPEAELVVTKGLGHMRILRNEDVVKKVVSFVTT